MPGPRRHLALLIAILLTPPTVFSGNLSNVPGWIVSGSAANKYQAVVDSFVAYDGSASASLAAITDAGGFEFGTLMQWVDARPHVGQRMQFSAYVRTAGVTTAAALWMRIDGRDGQVLAFDNMYGRGTIRGNQSWTRTHIVLDVPPDSKLISYGVLLQGEGMLWIDSVTLQPVFRHIATTGLPVNGLRLPVAPDELPPSPANTGFEMPAQL